LELIFYGGVGEIGGNKILVADEGTKVFLDFGQNFEKESNYFHYPYLAPREEKHLTSLGILPDIPGVYKCDEEACHDIAGVLVSHAHADHTNYIRYLKTDIDVYCSELSKGMIIARELSKPMFPSKYAIAKLTKREGERVNYKVNSLEMSKGTGIGDFKVTPFETDHSVLGSCGYLITSSGGSVVYTGDLRFHGARKEASWRFVEEAAELKPDVLIIEGTNIVDAKVSTEQDVFTRSEELISSSKHMVMVSLSMVDIDRLKTFHSIAKKVQRKLVVPIKLAFILNRLRLENAVDLNSPDIYIYRRQKATVYSWEREILDKYPNVRGCEDIEKEQDNVLMVAYFHDMNEMCEIKPRTGSLFIESQSEPFNEEMELDHKRLLNWLECYGLPLLNIHSSGHAFPHHLKEAIRKISPKKTFLIHTERPELYARYINNLPTEIITPSLGTKYEI
jgi:ribonuclease J